MVKGTTQQVIVVRAPESALFDEAIFLIRPGAAEQQAVTDRMLLEEARRGSAHESSRTSCCSSILYSV